MFHEFNYVIDDLAFGDINVYVETKIVIFYEEGEPPENYSDGTPYPGSPSKIEIVSFEIEKCLDEDVLLIPNNDMEEVVEKYLCDNFEQFKEYVINKII